MTDKEMKVERYREENKTAEKGRIVFTGSSLMEMFPINKLLEEHGSNTVYTTEALADFFPTSFWRLLTYALWICSRQRCLSISAPTI